MIDYRPATPADGPALDEMARTIWLETFGHAVSPPDIATYFAEAYGPEGRLIRDITNPATAYRLACDGDAIVGYAKLTPPFVPHADKGALQLSQFYIASSHHGTGIADVLLDWTIDTARARGASALLLTVWEDNHRAQRFYVKRGFVRIGDYAFPVGEQIDTDHVMRLAL